MPAGPNESCCPFAFQRPGNLSEKAMQSSSAIGSCCTWKPACAAIPWGQAGEPSTPLLQGGESQQPHEENPRAFPWFSERENPKSQTFMK